MKIRYAIIILAMSFVCLGAINVNLSGNNLPWYDYTIDAYDTMPKDINNLPITIREGLGVVTHPVGLSTAGLACLNAFTADSDPQHITNALQIVKALVRDSTMFGNARMFYYDFNFALHGGKDVMIAPWYSALAQGKCLSFFIRLWSITNNPDHYELALETFNSYYLERGKDNPWISNIVDGYLWFEEYPYDDGTQVFNGMCGAVFGLYDFYRLTGNPDSKILLDEGIRTLKDNVSKFRNLNILTKRGKLNWYCLKHHQLCDLVYQKLHIDYLMTLWHMTGEQTFLDYANYFTQDMNDAAYKDSSSGNCFITTLGL